MFVADEGGVFLEVLVEGDGLVLEKEGDFLFEIEGGEVLF